MFLPGNIWLINRQQAIEGGGINEEFGPNADLAYFEKTLKYSGGSFLPVPLSIYRISQNLSLQETVFWTSLFTVPSIICAIQKSMGASNQKCKHYFSEAVIIAYNSFPDIKHKLNFTEVQEKLQLPHKYYSVWVRRWVMVKNYLSWGSLLFRKSGKKA